MPRSRPSNTTLARFQSLIARPEFRPAWFVLVLGVALAIAFWHFTGRAIQSRADDRFSDLAERILAKTRLTMTAYEQVLRGANGLIKTNGEDGTTRSAFRRFIDAMDIERDYPGLQGIGYAAIVPADEKAAHEARIRGEGFPDYRIHPEGPRDIYSAIVFLEPFDWRNRRAFGYDMFADATRRAAMVRARDLNEPALSGRVTLMQEINRDVQSGFLLYMPVYKAGARIATPDDRRAALRGYVYAPFRAGRLMNALLARDLERAVSATEFAIYDGAKADASTLLFKTAAFDTVASGAEFRWTTRPVFYGRTWTFVFASTPRFQAGVSRFGSAMALLAGLLLTALLTAVIGAKTYRQIQLARVNAQMALMARELSHRVKNTLAVVQVIASRSLAGQRSVGEAQEIFLQRLHALSRAHSLLLETLWHGASLSALAREELAAFSGRATIQGPEVALNASSAQTLALVLHELTTNAIKYGAFSTANGRVSLRWWIEDGEEEPVFHFAWREEGGPAVSEPTHRGFGRTLLAQRLGHGGEAPRVDYNEDGLRYTISAPLASITKAGAEDEELRQVMASATQANDDDQNEQART